MPKPLVDGARAKAGEDNQPLLSYLEHMARRLPKEHGDRRKIWRGFYALRNLAALGTRHTTITSLVEELLSQRVPAGHGISYGHRHRTTTESTVGTGKKTLREISEAVKDLATRARNKKLKPASYRLNSR
mgnify:CR=1 FL=1